MDKFQFKYEAVLRQLQATEEQRQRELAQHLRHRSILHDRLQQMQQTVRDAKQQLTDGLVGAVDVDRIRGFAGYSGQVTNQAQQTIRELAKIEQNAEASRAALAEAMRQRKAMELLRDRHYRRWLEEQKRREAAELDELAVQRYARGLTMESTT